MKIAIVSTAYPFVYGGAELLADNLKIKLIENGHQAVIIRVPFQWYPSQKILEHSLAFKLLDFSNYEKVIALKFPAYFIRHKNKTIWLIHQFRQAYDFWGTPFQDIPNNLFGQSIRQYIMNIDKISFEETDKIFSISKNVSNRLKKNNNIDSQVLYPPLSHKKYFCNNSDDYFFCPSRINPTKRQLEIVKAFKYSKSQAKLVIAGSTDTPLYLNTIKDFIKNNHLENRIKLIDRWISEEEKINLLANCRGCIFVPHDEDYGYVTMESFYSKKPIITFKDSGGVLEFVENNINGYISTPNPKELASYIDKLSYDKKLAVTMGVNGYKKINSMNITWDNVIKKLLID